MTENEERKGEYVENVEKVQSAKFNGFRIKTRVFFFFYFLIFF